MPVPQLTLAPTLATSSASSSSSEKPLTLSAISFGIWRIADGPSPDSLTPEFVLARIKHCLSLGITTFDAADIYGGGQGDGHVCESLFGRALELEPGLRSKIQIISKTGIACLPGLTNDGVKHYNLSVEYILKQVDGSLKALQTSYMDLLLIHRPSPLMNADEVAEAFKQLHASGKVKHFGVSNFTVPQFNLLQSRLPFSLVTNQIECHPLHREPLHDGTLDHHQQYQIKPMIWSPLAGGRLVNKSLASSDVALAKLQDQLAKVASSLGSTITPDMVAYAWLLNLPSKPVVVIGTSSLERITAAAKACDIKLSLEQWFSIWQAAAGREVP